MKCPLDDCNRWNAGSTPLGVLYSSLAVTPGQSGSWAGLLVKNGIFPEAVAKLARDEYGGL